jgi:endonuclease/exonuclease/phosphatase family metal-dependent hydrolase
MQLTIATLNLENLLRRLDLARDRETGAWVPDPAAGLYEPTSEAEGQLIEKAVRSAISDDQRQLTAQLIRDLDADVLCLQEVDDLKTLRWFHDRYVRRAVRQPYEHFALFEGNDTRGIDVAVMARRGFPFTVRSHAALTYADLGLYNEGLKRFNLTPQSPVFKRDCLEVTLEIEGGPLTLFVCHFKSMGEDRERTMPIRIAEARAVRRIVEIRFGRRVAEAHWAIVGDLNDYRAKRELDGDPDQLIPALPSGLDPLFEGHWCHNVVDRLPPLERWTHYWSGGRELSQLDYILLSPALAKRNPEALPRIERRGLPFRAPWPTVDAEPNPADRYPRVGYDRPKASDHAGVAFSLEFT